MIPFTFRFEFLNDACSVTFWFRNLISCNYFKIFVVNLGIKYRVLFGSKLQSLPNYGNASKFPYLKNFNNAKYIIQTQLEFQMTDFNENNTRKFDLNTKKMQLKIDFDSSLTCYNLDPKSILKYFFTQKIYKTEAGFNFRDYFLINVTIISML